MSALQTATDTDARYLETLSIGYGLDGGGYAFERPDPALGLPSGSVIWDDPDFDYILGSDMVPHDNRGDTLLFAFLPHVHLYSDDPSPFPATLAGPWEDTEYRQVCAGYLCDTDRECNCHGKREETSGAAGEPTPDVDGMGWFYTGNVMDDPNPDCERCEGYGYVDSAGGMWAIYAVVDTDPRDDRCEDCDDRGYPHRTCPGCGC